MGFGEQKEKISFSFCLFSFYVRERRKKGKRVSKLLSSILRVIPIGIYRAKSESSSTQQGLHVGNKKEGFHRRSKGGYFELGRFPTHAIMLQEVEILPILVYFHLKGLILGKMCYEVPKALFG